MRRLQKVLAWILLVIGLLPALALLFSWGTVEVMGCMHVSAEGCALKGTTFEIVIVGLVFFAGYFAYSWPLAAVGALWLLFMRRLKKA
ncbi:hypothetical protein [Shimia biformata]|uniref:hypothetical protein n=1 Tax=Shimia biformata TaxID=1294299 RepID=UPI00194F5357|nr:hypothetical protein [Shimia biformata]